MLVIIGSLRYIHSYPLETLLIQDYTIKYDIGTSNLHVHAKHMTTVYNFTVHVKLDGHKLYYFVSW